MRHIMNIKKPVKELEEVKEDEIGLEERKSSNARLTSVERHIIARLLAEGKSCSEVGVFIGRGKNTVVKEIRRNGGKEKYDAEEAQKESDLRDKKGKESKKKKLRELARTDSYFNPYLSLHQRIEALEMQIEILTDTIKEIMK